jgi:mRNA interferase YafQ
MYSVESTGAYKRDIKRLKKRCYAMSLLDDVVTRLAAGEALEPSFRDHQLVADYDGGRECHVRPNWVLVYEKNEDAGTLRLVRTGTHSDLEL